MAVASFERAGAIPVMRNFPAPKRAAELKYWYKAARKVIPVLPEWHDRLVSLTQIDIETIIIRDKDWSLFIARKRNLRG